MEWNQEKVATILQLARLEKGWSIERVGEEAGVKACVVSSLERNRHRRPPNRDTQEKLETALGVSLPISRVPARAVCVYVPTDREHIVAEAVRKFPKASTSNAILSALEEWVTHREALDEWRREHPEKS